MLASQNRDDQVGQVKVHLSSVDSTNNYAANLLKAGLAHSGTVILADEQTNGRGQRGETWQSKPGMNLQFTVIWKPKELLLANQRYLNFAVSIAIVKYLEKHNLSSEIKWPNDILVDEKKICGILIENQIQGNRIAASIIGIGLNVNQLEFDGFSATSIKKEKEISKIPKEELESLLYELNKTLAILSENKTVELEQAYCEKMIGYQETRSFQDNKGPFQGEIKGVDSEGNLMILRKEGLVNYGIKEVKFLF